MPVAGGDYRAAQVSMLRAMNHAHLTQPSFGNDLQELLPLIDGQDAQGDKATTIRLLRRDFERNCKLPVELVKQISQATVRGQQVWDAARKADDFKMFAPSLREIVKLKREAGNLLAGGGDPYEALVDEYEPDAKIETLNSVFQTLREPLKDLVSSLQHAPRQPQVAILERHFPLDAQRQLSRYVAESIGFDFRRGRLDETSHPFCTSLGPDDCRILSRYDESLGTMLTSNTWASKHPRQPMACCRTSTGAPDYSDISRRIRWVIWRPPNCLPLPRPKLAGLKLKWNAAILVDY